MTNFTREWLAAEAARQGLALDDADVEEIFERVAAVKQEMAQIRPGSAEDIEPVYRFAVPQETSRA